MLLFTVVGMDRYEVDWYASDNNVRETPRGSRRSRMRAGSKQAVSRRPCCAVAWRRTARSEHGMASVNQTRPHCLNQMGKIHSKTLAARHGRGTVWARHGHGMLCVNRPLRIRKVLSWTVLINESEKSSFFVFTVQYSLKQTLSRISYCSPPFSEFFRTLLTTFPTPTCQNPQFQNKNFAST